jgi:hypothetical protein
MSASLDATLVPSSVRFEQSCKFGTVVQALWPIKPAYRLAEKIGCTERAARLYIDGERKPSAKALAAVISEIID